MKPHDIAEIRAWADGQAAAFEDMINATDIVQLHKDIVRLCDWAENTDAELQQTCKDFYQYRIMLRKLVDAGDDYRTAIFPSLQCGERFKDILTTAKAKLDGEIRKCSHCGAPMTTTTCWSDSCRTVGHTESEAK